MAPKAAKQVLPPNPPADETRTLPLAYTSFHPPPFVNAKNVSSSYLKTEAQTWVSRSHRPTKRPKTGADGADGDDDIDPASRRLVIHIGSEAIRIGRATDLYPTVVPHVLARQLPHPRAQPARPHATEAQLEMLRAELRSIMRQYKLRPVSNGWQSANSYNSSVEPERVAAHNDVYHVGFVDEGDASVVVGHEALRLASLSRPSAWRLFSPWTRGMLNVTGYAAEYGDACIEALLGDVQRILTHAISSAPSKASGPAGVADDAGLGIPTSEYGDYAVLLLVPDSFSRSDLRALGHVLLRYMGFSALHVQTEGLCATFGAGLSAACVVDVGATSIGISCVEEGLVLPETRVALSYGGQDMSRFFGDVLRGSSFPYTDLQEARLADAQLLQDLKERFVTLQPSQVGLNLYDFMVRLPGETARKYALRLYDEPILAGLMLFHPDVAAPPPMPRRPLTCAQPAPAEEADEPEPTAVLAAANASLGGDEAVELCASAVLDMAPTLAMLGCVSRRLSPQVAALVDMRADEASEEAPRAAPAIPQTSAMATQAAKCASAAAQAAQDGIDVVQAASLTPLDHAVFRSLLASTGTVDGALAHGGEERLRRLANNIVCTGGAARIPGLSEALEARVSMLLAEHYAPADGAPGAPTTAPQAVVIPPPRNLDPASLAWKGLAVMAHLDAMQELWIQASDWDTLGYRALKEKSLFL